MHCFHIRYALKTNVTDAVPWVAMIVRKRNLQAMDAGLAIVLILLLSYHIVHRDALVSIAFVLLLVSMTIPEIFGPFARIWAGLSEFISRAMSQLLLTLVFTLMVVPIGLAIRFMGKDPLKLAAWRSGAGSLFMERNHRFRPSDMERPY